MLLTYSLKTGLNNRGESSAAAAASAERAAEIEVSDISQPCNSRRHRHRSEDSFSNDDAGAAAVVAPPPPPTEEGPAAPFDCWWASMIPRELEDGVPPPLAPPSSSPSSSSSKRGRRRRRTTDRPQQRVLYASPKERQQQQQQRDEPQQTAATHRTSPSKKSVSFASEKVVHYVPSRKSYTPTERSRTWLTRRDLLRIKSDAGRVVGMMRRGQYIDEYACTDDVTTRGLERHASEAHNEERRERKIGVARAVLEEQARRRFEGKGAGRSFNGRSSSSSSDDLRSASLSVSWRSAELARAAAEWDEYVVRAADAGKYYDYESSPATKTTSTVSRVVSDENIADNMEEDDDVSPCSSPRPSPPSSPEPEPMDLVEAVEQQEETLEPQSFSPPPSPKGRHKRTAAEAYFGTYDVLGDEDKQVVENNTPPPPVTVEHSYYQYQEEQGYEVSSSYPHCHHQAYHQQQMYAPQPQRSCDQYYWQYHPHTRTTVVCQ